MTSLMQLAIPIVAAAVLVFVMSSLIHMVFKWHNADYRGLANEDEVRRVLRATPLAPGQYLIPYCPDHKDLQKPEVVQKFVEGPAAMLVVRPSGAPTMGKPLAMWFVLNLVIALLAGYLAARALPPGASFLAVARIVSIVTFVAYGGGAATQAIWMGKPWASAAKELLDAFIYGTVSALAFAWLWPR